MEPDKYGKTTIRNIYYDTDNFRLIRHSIEKPAYKEKLRIRSYGKAEPYSPVFVELKKKYDSVVYKRRMAMAETEAMEWVAGELPCLRENQIVEEIDYFLDYYEGLRPVVFLSYEREAFFAKDGSDFRVTFDDNILCRQEELSLEADVWGTPLLDDSLVLMELKCSGGIPLWMSRFKKYIPLRKQFQTKGTGQSALRNRRRPGTRLYLMILILNGKLSFEEFEFLI